MRILPELSTVDVQESPPKLVFPRSYNAAFDLIERNLRAGRGNKIAFIDDRGSYSYAELAERVYRFASGIRRQGIEPEQRVMLCLLDTIDFPTAFLGCIMAGVIPIAVNTLLTTEDYQYMLEDSRARSLLVSETLLPKFSPLQRQLPYLKHVIVSGNSRQHQILFSDLVANGEADFSPAQTTPDDMCFWLYSSGSTGSPKGTVHLHASLIQTAELYARPILGITEDDVVFSAAKLYFAYGLGNGLTFPLAVGATAVLMEERPTPDSVFSRMFRHQPTIFYGVPTLYAALLASPQLPQPAGLRLRRCTSAGEALPEDIGRRWTEHFGVEILDGLGSTEMLHIYLSNRPGEVRYGTTGIPVPGYELRLIDDTGHISNPGEIGELQVAGPTSAMAYWNKREKSRATFEGNWTRSGDKYFIDGKGYFVFAGRSDDMLKVSGIYVMPIAVESALISHEAVLEAAVVGKADDQGLIKPLAWVVLKQPHVPSLELEQQLKNHVKTRLAPHSYPRWIEFVSELPKTATGKIQRFKLRPTDTLPDRGAGA